MEARGWLGSAANRGDGRRTRVYSVTPKGRAALKRWIGPPLADAAITVAHDPLRSRARFLGVLSPAEQAAWVAGAIAAMSTVAARVRAWDKIYGRSEDPIARAMTRSGEMDVRSRAAWLNELAAAVKAGRAVRTRRTRRTKA
jgi:DNA-binding PadR family transcriptional regulator